MIPSRHLMVGGVIRFRQHGQVKLFPRSTFSFHAAQFVSGNGFANGIDSELNPDSSLAIRGFRLFFPADATVYLSCAQRAGRFS